MGQQELGCLWAHSFSGTFFSHHSLPRGTAFMGTLPVSSNLESLPAPGRASVKMICRRLAHSLSTFCLTALLSQSEAKQENQTPDGNPESPTLKLLWKTVLSWDIEEFLVCFIIHGVTLCHSEVGRLLGSSLTVNEEMWACLDALQDSSSLSLTGILYRKRLLYTWLGRWALEPSCHKQFGQG